MSKRQPTSPSEVQQTHHKASGDRQAGEDGCTEAGLAIEGQDRVAGDACILDNRGDGTDGGDARGPIVQLWGKSLIDGHHIDR